MSDHIKSLEQCLFQAQNAAIDLVAQIKALENRNKDLLKAARDSKWEERQKVEKEFHAVEARLKAATDTLQWYADASYERTVSDTLGYLDSNEWQYEDSDVIQDGGERARTALMEIGFNVISAPHDAQTPVSPPRQGLEAWVGTDISASAHEPSPPKPE